MGKLVLSDCVNVNFIVKKGWQSFDVNHQTYQTQFISKFSFKC